MKTTLFAAALTLAAFAGTTAPASASDTAGTLPTIDVTYADLNLGNRSGAEVLLQRIRSAASVVCGGDPRRSFRELKFARQYRNCVRAAVEAAVRQVNAPLVTALHLGVEVSDPRFAQGPADAR